MYDPNLVADGWKLLGDGFSQLALPDRSFISAPFVAWLVAPFTVLPVPAAYLAWSVLTFGGLLFAAWLLSSGRPLWRWSQMLLPLWLAPVLLGLMLGQVAFLVLAAVAACWWLLRHDRPAWAGLALATIWLKPQVAALVPPMLLVLKQRRVILVWLGASAVLAAAVIIVLRPGGLETYLHVLQTSSQRPLNTAATLARVTGSGLGTAVVQAGVVVLTLATGWARRHQGVELPLAAAIAGSLLASRYLHPYDFTMLLASVWLILRASPPAWLAGGMALLIPAAELSLRYGALPLLASAAALLVAIGALSFAGGRAYSATVDA